MVDTKGKLAYEHLCQCIQEFEEAALKSNNRAGMMAVMNSSLQNAELILDSQEQSLMRVSKARENMKNSDQSRTAGDQSEETDDNFFSKLNNEGIQLVDEDVDINELFGGSKSPVAGYLQDCLGCDLRLRFDWQIQPLNLLLPIDAFLDTLLGAIDRILARIDPWRILEDICWGLNHLKTLCPQDIILVLLALKMLLKKYLLQMFNIKLDWTVLLGPLLKALISALTDLLDNIFAILMAPLDCALSGLKAANDLFKAARDLSATLGQAKTQVGDFFDGLQSKGSGGKGVADSLLDVNGSGGLLKDVSWLNPSDNDPSGSALQPGNQGLDVGVLQAQQELDPLAAGVKAPPLPEDALRIPAGFVLKSDSTMLDALRDPSFPNSTWLEKLMLPLTEAIAWIRETYLKFVGALRSLEGLVGGGLGLSLDNLGIMIFITDMISLVLMIIKLLSANVKIKDWCTFLQENPQVLEEAVRSRFGDVSVLARGAGPDAEILLMRGPDVVGTVKTCVNSRSDTNSGIINQWIAEIEARGALT